MFTIIICVIEIFEFLLKSHQFLEKMSSERVPLHKVIEMSECGSDLRDIEITLLPPNDGQETDEESGNECHVDMNHLPGRILQAEVEVHNYEDNISPNLSFQEVNHADDPTENGNLAQAVPEVLFSRPPAPKKPKLIQRVWINSEQRFQKIANGDEEERTAQYNGPEHTCVEWFEMIFTDDILTLITNQTNKYASQRNHTLNVTKEEIKVFISIFLVTGYLSPKYIKMFWETQSDTHNTLISSAMRRNRFFEIQKYLHLADISQLQPNDKFYKVREYLTILTSIFQNSFVYIGSSHISVDETMIPYYGKHSAKQHIHGKPIKFGYKFWSAATPSGYLISFEPYQDSKNCPLPLEDEIGLGAAVVLELQSRLPLECAPYNLYIDRFFSSLKLLDKLTERKTGGTGTILENRTEKCPVISSMDMKKKPRGTFDFKNTSNIMVVKWRDNSVVTAISNCHGVRPITKVDRIGTVNKIKQKVQVDCPNIIKKYNTYMGGVDRFDENIHGLRVSYRGRKWWFSLFAFGLDAACHNAWILKKKSGESSTICEFRRAIAQFHFFKYGTHIHCALDFHKKIKPCTRLDWVTLFPADK